MKTDNRAISMNRELEGPEHLVDIEKDLDAPVRFGHPQDEIRVELHAEGGGVFDIGLADVKHFRDGVHHNTHGHCARIAHDLHDDDAGTLRVVPGHQAETKPQVDDGNDLAAQVDDPLDELGRLWHRGNRHHADDLPDLENADAILLAGQRKGQI